MPADVLEATPSAPVVARRSRRRRWAIAGAALAAAAVAVGAAAVTVAVTRDDSSSRIDQRGYAPAQTLPPVGPGQPVSFGADAAPATDPATTPTDAVARFFAHEIAGEFLASFAFLSDADRAGYGTAEDWEATHDELPTYLTASVVAVDGATVVADVTIEPAVDEVVGVIHGAARLTIPTVREDGGVRIELNDVRVDARYPADELASAAALAWIAAKQACDTTGAREFGGSLVGMLGLTDRLCRAAGTAAARAPVHLDALRDPTFVVSSFGPSASSWARIVTVTGIAGIEHIDVVLAPLGGSWVVIGATS